MRWIKKLFGIALFATILIAGFGQAVLQLWNLLMPDIFGLHTITFWQAVGLMALSWILFGGLGIFRGRPLGGKQWQRRMAERFERMSPEQRDRFREQMKRRFSQV